MKRAGRTGLCLAAACSLLCPIAPLAVQASDAPRQPQVPQPLDVSNPLEWLGQAEQILPQPTSPPGGLSSTLSIVLLLTVLAVAPALLIMTTCFTRVVVVLALLRQAIGTQSLPPAQVIVGLALFITLLVMAPTFQRVNAEALVPLNDGLIDQREAWSRARTPVKEFMLAQIANASNWDDIYMILEYRYGAQKVADPARLTYGDVDMLTLIPAFILSELKVAFLMGFRLYLPFLIIDMVVASVLISMGMLMLPPVLISLPFKLLLFVLVDGWHLVVGNLLSSFSTVGIG